MTNYICNGKESELLSIHNTSESDKLVFLILYMKSGRYYHNFNMYEQKLD